MENNILLSEFDDNSEAVINPGDVIEKIPMIPRVAVTCFSEILFNRILSISKHRVIGRLSNTNGKKEIYEIEYRDKKFVFFMMGVGAPLAVMDMEDVHMMGVEKFVVFGNCGVLDKKIDDCMIIIPNRALRDEGVSFHYQRASRDILLNRKYVDLFREVLRENEVSFVEGTTWTTDAFYRETKSRVNRRRDEGAITVEMEAASLQAVADFRRIDFNIFFYAGDNLDNSLWDKRSLSGDVKIEKKMELSLFALEWAYRIMEMKD